MNNEVISNEKIVMAHFKKRKLVIASDSFLPRWDGVARFLVEIIFRLKKYYDITVLTANFEGHYDDPSIKIVRFPIRNFKIGDFPPAKPDKKIIRNELMTADLVWVQTIGSIGASTINIAKDMGKKLVAYIHSVEWELVPSAVSYSFLKAPLYAISERYTRRFYGKCDVLLVPTKEVAEKFTRHGVKSKKIVIPLGVDSDTFFPINSKDTAKLEIGIDPSLFIIGYVGRIAHEKDLKTLLRAYSRINKKHENTRLLIVGDGVESIKKLLSSKKGVILVGAKDNVIPYLHAMDIYVLPSLTETTSLSTLEAMSCELPVIVTKVGLAKEYIKPGVNGFLFDKRDEYSLYRNMQILMRDKALAINFGKNARKTVLEQFSWKSTVDKILEELAKI